MGQRTGKNLNQNVAKEVRVYYPSLGGMDGSIIYSREKASIFLDISSKVLRYQLDNWRPGGIKGYYVLQ